MASKSRIHLRTLAAAGAGVACMALTLLSLCHPVEVHPLDFLLHVAAGITIILGTILLGGGGGGFFKEGDPESMIHTHLFHTVAVQSSPLRPGRRQRGVRITPRSLRFPLE